MKVANKFSPLLTCNQRQKLTSKKVVLKVSPHKKKDVEDPINLPEDVESKKKHGRKRSKKVVVEEKTKKSTSAKLRPIPKKPKNKDHCVGKKIMEDKAVDEAEAAKVHLSDKNQDQDQDGKITDEKGVKVRHEKKKITSILVKSILKKSTAKSTKEEILIKNIGSGMKKRFKPLAEKKKNVKLARLLKKAKTINGVVDSPNRYEKGILEENLKFCGGTNKDVSIKLKDGVLPTTVIESENKLETSVGVIDISMLPSPKKSEFCYAVTPGHKPNYFHQQAQMEAMAERDGINQEFLQEPYRASDTSLYFVFDGRIC
jgi:hypothetical protein